MTGGLYYVDPANSVTEAMVPLGELPLADGLELVAEEDGTDTLYVSQSTNQISMFKIAMMDGAMAPSAELHGVLHTGAYETPATSAVVGDTIWTANLGPADPLPQPGEKNTATYDGTFTVVGASRFAAEEGSPTPPPPTVAQLSETSGSSTTQWFAGHTFGLFGLVVTGLLFVFV